MAPFDAQCFAGSNAQCFGGRNVGPTVFWPDNKTKTKIEIKIITKRKMINLCSVFF